MALFQKYRVRNEKARWATVLACERLTLVLPDHPGLTARHILKWEVRCIPGVGCGQYVGRRHGWSSRGKEGVDGNSSKGDPQLRPGRHAVDIAAVGRVRKSSDLFPRPFHWLLNQTPDREGPGRRRDRRRGLGREHRPIPTHVILTWRQTRVAIASAVESSRELHDQTLPASTPFRPYALNSDQRSHR